MVALIIFYSAENQLQDPLSACRSERTARRQCNSVNWSCFTNKVQSKMNPNKRNLSLCISCFNDILNSAAVTHMGNTKPSKKSKTCMTRHMSRAKIHTRNFLHWTVHQNPDRNESMLAMKPPRLSTRPR